MMKSAQFGVSLADHSQPMRYPPKTSPRTLATDIVRRLQSAGHAAFWVGGCVRDQLLGRLPEDFDIATSAPPEVIESLFERTIGVGRKFGVVVVVEDRRQFQVATFRAEAEYHDGRRPTKVTFADARADAERRDFTVNGLFFDPVAEKLHDWVRGAADIKAKLIRTIGNPHERFAEDHLRLLRAVRFAAQLGFDIERATFAALKVNAPRIELISAERVRGELVKLFRPPHAARGLVLLRDSGLLKQILPELAATEQCDQSPDFHPEGNVFEHLRLMLSSLPAHASPALPWAVLLHDVAKPVTAERDPDTGSIHFYGHERLGAEMAEKILQRLRFPKKQIAEVVTCIRHHMQFKDVMDMRKATLRRMILRPTFPLELELHRLDCLGSHGRLDHYEYLMAQSAELERKPSLRPPLVNGDDLMALGMPPGPQLGALLVEIRDKQLAGEFTTAEQARDFASRRLGRRAD
jgi:poly(A) polymerase